MSDEWLCPHCKRLHGNHAAWCEIGMKNQLRPTISEERVKAIVCEHFGHNWRDVKILWCESAIKQALREAGVTITEGKP